MDRGAIVIKAADVEAALTNVLWAESNSYASVFGAPKGGNRCSIPDCGRRVYAKGLCNAHYQRRRIGIPSTFPVKNRKGQVPCLDCWAPPNGKGGWMRCPRHYKARRARLIKVTLIALFGGACQDCAQAFHPAAFDFHHLEGKDDAISSLIANGSVAKIAAEVVKCMLLCSNCHRVTHAGP